jgi:dynein light chain 1
MPPGSSDASAGQSLAAAIKQFNLANPGKRIEEEQLIKLLCTTPPIDKIDNSVNSFVNCVQLSLSTNGIDKIPLLPKSGLPKIEILSLGRNQIKKISGLEEIGDTLRELWISYNQISTLDGLNCCTNLETLFISNNKIKEMAETKRLTLNPALSNLNIVGNPIYDNANRNEIRTGIIRTVPSLRNVDGEIVTDSERLSSATRSARRNSGETLSTPAILS